MARDRDVASSTHANKDTLSESNSSGDLRVDRWRGWPSQAFGMTSASSRLFQVETCLPPPPFFAIRTPIRLTCDECCPQILSRLFTAQRFLKMKLQTISVSSATAAPFIVLSLLMAASALPVPQLSLAPRVHDGSFQSTNWSGYAVTGASGCVSDAKGSWAFRAIKGTCPGTNQYSSFWVGIDGFSSGTVEQTGTDSDCQNGAPTYYAWYEFYPHPSFLISGLTVRPGDHMTAEASFNGRSFTVTIMDASTGVSFSTSARVRSAQRSSAEWIAEAPSSSGGILPLADFGTVSYSSCTATVNGTPGTVGSFGSSVQVITMVSNSGAVKAQPSSLSSSGNSFSVTWKSSGP